MRSITATEASRGFSDLLDSVQRGDTITITRGGLPVAVVSPARRYTVDMLMGELAQLERLDEDFEADLTSALELVRADYMDPWRED